MLELTEEFVKSHKIKRIIHFNNLAYYVDKNIPPDTARIQIFNEDGLEMRLIEFYKNRPYSRIETTRDSIDRVIRVERFELDRPQGVTEYDYLPNDNFMVWMGDFMGEMWYMQTDKELMTNKAREFWSDTLNYRDVQTRASLDLLV
jgi:hypothetical protein